MQSVILDKKYLSVAGFTISPWKESGSKKRHWGIYFKIKDCSDTVELEFDFSSEKERELRLRKLNKLINVLLTLRDRIESVEL